MRINNEKQLAALLEDARKKKGLSQEGLGGKVGLLRKTVDKLEKNPGSSQVGNLLKQLSALGLDLHISPKDSSSPRMVLKREIDDAVKFTKYEQSETMNESGSENLNDGRKERKIKGW